MVRLRALNHKEATKELYALALGPDVEIQLFDACVVNGIRYHAKTRDAHRSSQNSGVTVPSSDDKQNLDFFGVLKDVVQIFYMFGYKTHLFWCDWFQCSPKKKSMVQEFGRTCIDISKRWYDDDPFILATQAQQVYYLDDIKHGGYWKVVEKVQHQGIYEVMEKKDENDESSLCEVNPQNEPIQELMYRERILLDFCELFIGTQMPPKRVQDLPGLSFGDGNHSTSDVDSSSCIRSKRRDTRATHSDMLRNLIERQGKIPVTFRKVDGRPSGQYAAAFMTELGPNSIRKETDKLMNARYRDNRCKMHDHYLSLVHIPWERRLMDVPFDYCDTVKDWEFMCTLFESEAFKRRLKVNKENRSKLLNNHRGGSKSFIRHSYDGTKRKDRITVYGDTHFSLKNGWIGSTKAIYEHMVQLRDNYKDKQMETGGSKPLTDLEISAIVCDEVLGMRPGYIRGMGNGPKPATWMFYDASSNQPTNEELKNELQATQDELKYVRAEQEMMKEAFEKIFPGALQSMFRHSSSIAPSPSPPTAI
ncbi:hypothetical protein C2S52_020419 [Perilla frutescens var. hirtella]|nr:hypothetical protein C2S52_020419 [Perilla frutescens var. hirtella]